MEGRIIGSIAWRRRLIGAAWVLTALVLVLWLWVDRVGPLPGDRLAMTTYRGGQAGGRLADLSHFLYFLATPSVAALTVTVATWVVARNVSLAAGLAVPAAAAAVLPNAVLKWLLGPPAQVLEFVVGDRASYPSGHVAYAAALFGWLAIVGWRTGRREVSVIMIALAAAMGPARVLAGAHFPSDVVGGYAVGGAWLVCLVLVWDRFVVGRATPVSQVRLDEPGVTGAERASSAWN